MHLTCKSNLKELQLNMGFWKWILGSLDECIAHRMHWHNTPCFNFFRDAYICITCFMHIYDIYDIYYINDIYILYIMIYIYIYLLDPMWTMKYMYRPSCICMSMYNIVFISYHIYVLFISSFFTRQLLYSRPLDHTYIHICI